MQRVSLRRRAARGVAGALAIVLAVAHPLSLAAADQPVSSLTVTLDEPPFKKTLSVAIGQLFTDQFDSDNPACRAAAILVAQQAADNYGYWAGFIDLLQQTAKGVELGASIGGAKTVAKVAQVAGTIVDAFDQDEPAAALGQAFVNETAGWLSGQIPKTGNDTADQAIKEGAEKAKNALVNALFPGKTQRARTHHTTVGNCSVDVTIEMQWPGPNKGQVGGMRVFVSGDCGCQKPLKLNSGLVPTTFRGQTDDIKNCGLGRFHLVLFVPMERLDTAVSFGGSPSDIPKLLKTAAKFKKAVEDARDGKESDTTPKDVADDIQGQVGKGTNFKATLILRPVFSTRPVVEAFSASCGDCDGPRRTVDGGSATGGGTPTEVHLTNQQIAEKYCEEQCRDQWLAYQAALTEQATLPANLNLDAWLKDLAADEAAANELLNQIHAVVQEEADQLSKMTEYAAYAKSHNVEPDSLQSWRDARTRRDNAKARFNALQARYDEALRKAANTRKTVDYIRGRLAQAAAKVEETRTAYYNCAAKCWDRAKGDPQVTPPNDVQTWTSEHKTIGMADPTPKETTTNVSVETTGYAFDSGSSACDGSGTDACVAPASCTSDDCADVTAICTSDPAACSAAPGAASSLQPYQLVLSGAASTSDQAMHDADADAGVARFIALVARTQAPSRHRTVSIVATGASTGVAFHVEVRDPSGRTRRIAMPEGVVLEPIGTGAPLRARPAGGSAMEAIGGYCLDFAKLPPAPGMRYRIANAATQARFAPMRSILAAARRLAAQGRLHPDSDPAGYVDGIRQYALWTRIEGWNADRFAREFVARTRKNVEALKQPWTREIEQAVRGVVPGRWADIQAVIADAAAAPNR